MGIIVKTNVFVGSIQVVIHVFTEMMFKCP